MSLADRLSSRTVYGSTVARIVASCGLCCERLASRFDCTEAMLASRFGHARIAMLTSALEHRLKRLGAKGREPAPGARGLTIPRPLNVTSIDHMGKEVIVDPTDTPQDLTAEQLSATEPIIYRDAGKAYEAPRTRIRAAGISRVAREAKMSRSVVKAFVNQGTVPQTSTMAKLEAALARLRA